MAMSDQDEPNRRRRTIETTPFIDELVGAVQRHLGAFRGSPPSYAAALRWIIEDFAWCEPDRPAFGRMSPVMTGIVDGIMRSRAAEVEPANTPPNAGNGTFPGADGEFSQ